MTMEIIQHTELASAAASITFSSIPQTYTDLLIVFSARSTVTNTQDVYLQFNGDTSSGYTMRRLFGTGSGVASDAISSATATGFRVGRALGTNTTASTFSNCQVYIPNYRSSVAKSASSDQVDENNATASFQLITACLYSGTSAITSILMGGLGGSFAQYSSATLYGITSGSDGTTTVS
jgi:hypothetical protein